MDKIQIKYGTVYCNIDVTQICLDKLTNNNIITIDYGENKRISYFTDPVYGVSKFIFVTINNITTEYDDLQKVQINIITQEILSINVYKRVSEIHDELIIKYSSIIPLVIAHFLGEKNVNDFGSLKTDINNIAVQRKKIIESGWETMLFDISLPKNVNTIISDEVHIEFNNLFLDCESTFYYILMDMPNILDNIYLIIMENDYNNISDKNYVDSVLIENQFVVDYTESGCWGPCYNNYFEVWKRQTV